MALKRILILRGPPKRPSRRTHRAFPALLALPSPLAGKAAIAGPRSTRDAASFLPMPALLQRVDDLARHVVLVVLGQHARCGEDAVGTQLSFRDGALPLTEEIRQQAL